MKKNICLIASFIMSVLLLVGCGCEHTYSAATCTEPSKCTKCGEVQGEALGHDYKAATCTEGSKCSRCGAIDGSALGHTTDFGTCTRCNIFQGEDTAKKIIQYINNGNSKMNDANTNGLKAYSASDMNQLYKIWSDSTDYYKSAADYYKMAMDLCGSCSELSTLKSSLQTTINSCPSYPSSESNSALKMWATEEMTFRTSAVSLKSSADVLATKVGMSITNLEID